MKLQEAIETAQFEVDNTALYQDPDLESALQILIQAGKRIVAWRRGMNLRPDYDLPGETKDFCKLCGLVHTSIECPDRGGAK